MRKKSLSSLAADAEKFLVENDQRVQGDEGLEGVVENFLVEKEVGLSSLSFVFPHFFLKFFR